MHRLEELLLTRIANENPAVGPLRELVDDRPLANGTRYREAIAGLEATFAGGPPIDGDGLSLIELLRPPARRAPTSLAGQLRYIRDAGGSPRRQLLEPRRAGSTSRSAILAEEERALHLRFGGGGTAAGRPRAAAAAEATRRSSARPTSPRRSRRTRPGCRGSC